MASTSRNALTHEKKYKVLEMAKNRSMSVRALAENFSCGKSQITSILKNRDSINELYKSNMRSESIHSRKRLHSSEFTDVNKAFYKWYLLAKYMSLGPTTV